MRTGRGGHNGSVEVANASAAGDEAPPSKAAAAALSAFAAAALELVRDEDLDRGLGSLAHAVALGTGAELVVARLADADGRLVARAVHAESPALAAELEGTLVPAGEAPGEPMGTPARFCPSDVDRGPDLRNPDAGPAHFRHKRVRGLVDDREGGVVDRDHR